MTMKVACSVVRNLDRAILSMIPDMTLASSSHQSHSSIYEPTGNTNIQAKVMITIWRASKYCSLARNCPGESLQDVACYQMGSVVVARSITNITDEDAEFGHASKNQKQANEQA